MTLPPLPADAPPGFHLLAKPSGSTCNIDCTYCFFLSKEALYPNEKSRMSEATLETYIRQLLESHRTPEVTVAWQGGEPTLMKLEFFERSVELVEKYRRPGQIVQHTFQTNGMLLDDDWCAFFKEHNFLVGLSVDGPRELHDTYRRRPPRAGHLRPGDAGLAGPAQARRSTSTSSARSTPPTRSTAARSIASSATSWARSGCSSSRSSSAPPRRRSTIANQGWSEQPGRKRLLYTQTGNLVTERSVGGEQYGRFLVDIFEEWVRHDVGKVFVQLFDVTLEAYFGRHLLCIHAPTCGYGPALEHNGDLYSCDHFVEPRFQLGNIHETHMLELVASPEQRKFGRRQARHADRAVPALRGQAPVQRRLSEGPLRALARRRAGPELPLRGPGAVLHAHAPGDAGDGPAAAAGPRARRRDGVGRGRGRAGAGPISPAPAAAARSSASATATKPDSPFSGVKPDATVGTAECTTQAAAVRQGVAVADAGRSWIYVLHRGQGCRMASS